MKILTALMLSLVLAGCAEVTTFRRPDGSQFYYVNCGNSMKLESCSSAAARTCPKGYAKVADISNPAYSDSVYANCIQANQERALNKEPQVQCPVPKGTDNFFACK